jgi:hypothetical protein
MEIKEKILDGIKNVGSLCLFLNNKKNKEYLDYLNENIPHEVKDFKLSEKIYYFIKGINEIQLCDCGDPLLFFGFKSGWRQTCGKKECIVKSRKKTCLVNWGVDNPRKSKEIVERTKENILEKWGGKHYMMDDSVRNKFKQTMISNWGVEWAQQSKEISEKSKSTWDLNPNKDEVINKRSEKIKNKSINEKLEIDKKRKISIINNWGSLENFYNHVNFKIKEKSINELGVEHHLSHPSIIERRVIEYKETITNKIKSKLPNTIIYLDRINNKNKTDSIILLKCLNCKSEFSINRQFLVSRDKINEEICLNCNPRSNGKSKMEEDLYDFISENYSGDIIRSDKNLLGGREIDIYLPEMKLAFEFNGLYWHSEEYKDKFYHKSKSDDCESVGIELIHIWEDDWLYKNEIIKSIILNKLLKSKRIFARKCTIDFVSDSEYKTFLEKNHLKGFIGSKIKIGLYYLGDLVCLISLKPLKNKNWELLRFCNKTGVSVVGGASKLLSFFMKNYECLSFISYSDNSFGISKLYKLGFKVISELNPNYHWVINGIRSNKFNFRKDKLVSQGFDSNKTEVEIMNERGFYRIFDSGSKKWEIKY